MDRRVEIMMSEDMRLLSAPSLVERRYEEKAVGQARRMIPTLKSSPLTPSQPKSNHPQAAIKKSLNKQAKTVAL